MASNDSAIVDAARKEWSSLTFGWTDYSLFSLMLCVSAIIGIYFGFFAKKQENTTDYLLGGKTMGYFPVAMSMTASHLSGNTLLGIPTEVYQFGTQYAASALTLLIIGLLTAYIYLPVFYKLQLTSSFEYLEIRFARSVRQFTSVLYVINVLVHTPIVVYAPALAFSQVTGIDLHYVTLVISVVCIFYTTVGGLKAVVWTDTIQFLVTLLTIFIVLTLGIISVGGFGEIWRTADKGGRLILFDMNPSPFVRTSFWGITLGLTASWISAISINQTTIQRFLAVPTMLGARKAILISCIGLVFVKLLSVFTGLIMYVKYHDCDPIKTKSVSKPDQMVPFYLMDVVGNIPGLPGLFLAALVSSAFSSMSGGLNAVTGIIWEDFISPFIPESSTKQQTGTKLMKVTVVVLGVFCGGLVFVVEHLGEIFAMTTSLSAITSGTMAGLFTLGVLVPWATEKGAVVGGVTGFVVSTSIIVGAQIHKYKGNIRYEELPTTTDNCPFPMNMTDWFEPTKPPIAPENEPFIIFHVSFLYYALVGFLTVLICGTIASFVFGASNLDELNRDYFSPIVKRFLPREKYSEVPMTTIPKSPPTIVIDEKEEKEPL